MDKHIIKVNVQKADKTYFFLKIWFSKKSFQYILTHAAKDMNSDSEVHQPNVSDLRTMVKNKHYFQ